MDNVCIKCETIKKRLSARGHNQRNPTKRKKQKQKIVEINKKKRLLSQGRDYTHCQYQVTKN